MPRTSTDEEKPKKRAPKKRAASKAVRKRAPRKAATKQAVRKRASTEAAPTQTERAPERNDNERPARKAPTPIAARRAGSKAKRNQLLIVAAIFLVGVGSSAAIGFSDKGQIDVNQAIEERNERIRSGQLREGDTQQVIVPVQNTATNRVPDGGLVPLPESNAPRPAPEPATTTATSTDATATSTEATATSTAEISESDATTEEAAASESESSSPPEPTPSDDAATEEAPTSGP